MEKLVLKYTCMISCKSLDTLSSSLLPLPLQIANPNDGNFLVKISGEFTREISQVTLLLRNLRLSEEVHEKENGHIFLFPEFLNLLLLSLHTTINLILYFDILIQTF